MPPIHSAREIERVFAALFAGPYDTVLVGGGDEPLYEPARPGRRGRIVYREDFVASALHEVAHWCVAGSARRRLDDYGYWYAPDGRTPSQQAEFERVEVAPQALEWVFADACGLPFRPSADNVLSDLGPSPTFLDALRQRREALLAGALRGRARIFRDELAACRALRSSQSVAG